MIKTTEDRNLENNSLLWMFIEMMAGFTEGALAKKLADLNSSQQSIQTLSLWLIHHRKHHATIVKVWFRELQKAKDHRKLTFMYLANDVIQNSKKKGPEFGQEFGNVLRKAFENMAVPESDEKTRKSIERILQIWEERSVYDPKLIKEFRRGLAEGGSQREGSPPKKKVKVVENVRPETDKTPTKRVAVGRSRSPIRERKKSETEVEIEVDGMKELHVTLSPRTPAGDPPEPEELIKALMDLENSASSDALVREKIASLPPEVSEIGLLSKLEDKASAEKLSVQVNEAVHLLTDYNSRLASEMEYRKKLTTMLKDFLQAQKDLLAQAEHRLEEYTEKLQKVYVVRQEVKSHIQNLPDLTQLPDVTGGLAPLPSAGDLFSMH
ncbi:regulation of nuclear pre-mRNA domain-containing protein 1B isoform X1 [Zootermopsis nevadensis]|uniref:Regulation of nuclear pre-mRNA domain-containing protein 1B n=1 Tax=Zootermopsis nevadensis TaxID=136037 RepID=A0A067R5X5_ZOONE|nr:regulation of nuclear pre-mRNA domain-containing protein 1B isoform X1 [Zootermopsis nevadensis]KDR17745.1 Regulation of nuclear pre-mRNA domain-containing protein 1B [Zootermopsis nevadensis]